MPRINWIEESEAVGAIANVYSRWKRANNDRAVPDILKCFSPRPDVLEKIEELSNVLHFSDGHLNRRTKEKIASFVSALNRCKYGTISHSRFLQLQGGTDDEVAAVNRGDHHGEGFSPKETALFEFLRKNTFAPADIVDDDLVPVRAAEWTEPEIAEAVYVTAFFAMMNRVADAFGI